MQTAVRQPRTGHDDREAADREAVDGAPTGAREPATLAQSQPSRGRRAADVCEGEQLTFDEVQERLRTANRENLILKSRNRQLSRALADASRRGTAAHHLAHHDALTGLPNRLSLMTRLEESISTASSGESQIALLFIDLDDFKDVNDRLGHTVGDKLLTVVASRLLAAIRVEDIACRYGGDEFVVLMSRIRDAALVNSIAEKIRDRIDGSYGIDDNEVRISASIGFALYPTHGEHCDALLRHADASMYRSKAARRGDSEAATPNRSAQQSHSIDHQPVHAVDDGMPADGGRSSQLRRDSVARQT
jgi:diguanylate cyclase (GGDEF)-like protein